MFLHHHKLINDGGRVGKNGLRCLQFVHWFEASFSSSAGHEVLKVGRKADLASILQGTKGIHKSDQEGAG